MYYFIFNTLLLFFSFLKSDKLIVFLIILISLFYFGLMYPESGDFVGYFENYDCLNNGFCYEDTPKFELGFNLLNVLIGWGGYQLLLILIAVFNIWSVLIFSKRFKKRSFIFFSLFAPLAWVLYTETLRQSVAFSFVLIGIGYLLDGKWKNYIISVFAAAFFHSTAIVSLFFLLGFLSKQAIKNICIIFFFSIFVFWFYFESIINFLISFFGSEQMLLNKVIFYFSSDVYAPQLSLGLGIIPDIGLIFFIVLNRGFFDGGRKSNTVMAGVILFFIFVFFVGRYMPVFTRVGWYGLPFICILMHHCLWGSNISKYKGRRLKVINLFLIYIWIAMQVIRPLTYAHSYYNISQQEPIFMNFHIMSDDGMRESAKNKCLDLIGLGYDALCYIK